MPSTQTLLLVFAGTVASAAAAVDLSWRPPSASAVSNLTQVLNGPGVPTIFNSSKTSFKDYGIYNYCNMPHVRAREYPFANDTYELKYVEIIHRHHKRTPYQSNTFPVENIAWQCSDTKTFYYADKKSGDEIATPSYWVMYTDPANPLNTTGYIGSNCQFPQITADGLEDALEHGRDLFKVYGDKLDFLRDDSVKNEVIFRVTSNVITSQVAGAIIQGMFPDAETVPLYQQPSAVDSLQPQYSCSYADNIRSAYQGTNANWTAHLNATVNLFAKLDAISGVNPKDSGWHSWFDHYFDALSSRKCHGKPLPCSITNSSNCITEADAQEVFRLGLYEYSYIFRDAPNSLEYVRTKYGLFFVELVSHIRAAIAKSSPIKYRHNVAHDGSISPLLGFLQVDQMVWPGMGAEVAFELFKNKKTNGYVVRVLWGGKVLRSSNLGPIDMIPADDFIGYVEGLTGVNGSYIVQKCVSS
ncbi:phosphoglycerate mutase-like protein [Gonapodya prolifera JEL478]|uniref:Phosphoglycerate mutase-like protein n=1 Tax=Gonapodya prolifera (strain JEL478) TaxID=1344416 RepID=A0A138ZYT3_GONPJ|nr:phosphoglycerate mutase-like protein [Gonapodya prolifera JEL478]|eukprot:KXS09667.1 phosphoglycerate mutase-like protein [Gonapodya prolifera JEL478]